MRKGSLRVPAGSDGPALAALIAKEIARHERNLVNTLNQRDRDEQLVAMLGAPLYPDSVTRGLRSDAARVWKRHQWVKDALR